jgi:sugar-specific transcriptional regulator TrmB
VIEILKKLGLSEEEGTIYLKALELGSRPASVLARYSGLKPGHTYNILSRLKERGLIQEIEKGHVRYFNAVSPNKLLAGIESDAQRLRLLRESLTGVLPEILSMQAPKSHRSRVNFYHGREGVLKVLENAALSEEKLLLGVVDADSQDLVGGNTDAERLLADARARRVSESCWYHLLVSGSDPLPDILGTDLSRLRRVRRLPQLLKLPVQFLIYDGKLSIFTYREPLFAVNIEDSLIAESARNIFNSVWNSLEDFHLR